MKTQTAAIGGLSRRQEVGRFRRQGGQGGRGAINERASPPRSPEKDSTQTCLPLGSAFAFPSCCQPADLLPSCPAATTLLCCAILLPVNTHAEVLVGLLPAPAAAANRLLPSADATTPLLPISWCPLLQPTALDHCCCQLLLLLLPTAAGPCCWPLLLPTAVDHCCCQLLLATAAGHYCCQLLATNQTTAWNPA